MGAQAGFTAARPSSRPGAGSSIRRESPTLTWEPDRAEIAVSGDLGYTLGASVFKGVDKDGRPLERRVATVTIWRKTAGSPWQVVIDIGSDDEPVNSSAAAQPADDINGVPHDRQ